MKRFVTAVTAATVALMLSSSAMAGALETAMTPDIARMAGEINAATKRCGFKLRESERVFESLPCRLTPGRTVRPGREAAEDHQRRTQMT